MGFKIKTTKEEIQAQETFPCVEVWSCDKTRKCGWGGFHSSLATKAIDEYETAHVCPKCGNRAFIVSYYPLDASKFIIKA